MAEAVEGPLYFLNSPSCHPERRGRSWPRLSKDPYISSTLPAVILSAEAACGRGRRPFSCHPERRGRLWPRLPKDPYMVRDAPEQTAALSSLPAQPQALGDPLYRQQTPRKVEAPLMARTAQVETSPNTRSTHSPLLANNVAWPQPICSPRDSKYAPSNSPALATSHGTTLTPLAASLSFAVAVTALPFRLDNHRRSHRAPVVAMDLVRPGRPPPEHQPPPSAARHEVMRWQSSAYPNRTP